jgi:glycosyltransferase involved in cell wall biosynthesis
MNILFIADFFLRDGIKGGAELVDDELTSLLSVDHEIAMINSHTVDADVLKTEKYDVVLISNFINLHADCIKYLIENKTYFIFEHDHKYLKSRNPATYPNFEAPPDQIANQEFYKKAKAVFCQTKLHVELLSKNLLLSNLVNLSGSLWSETEFDILERNLVTEKTHETSVVLSSNPIKNTKLAVQFCESKDIAYSLVPPSDFETFISNLASGNSLVFFPATCESCCRLLVEARMVGCSVLTNDMAGAASEEWFKLSGKELIDEMRKNKKRILQKVTETLQLSDEYFVLIDIPKVSIITSVFDGDKFIEPFLKDITSQTIFKTCELILIDCNSPGNEKELIEKYMTNHDNIVYKKLDEDPGVYGAWNEAIKLSTGALITNANLDDRRAPNQIEELTRALMNNLDIDLAYSSNFVTDEENETFDKNSSKGFTYQTHEYSENNMVKCLPGAMPVWRATLHDKIGLFNEDFKSAGDWEMWLRAVDAGSRFKKVAGTHGLYYMNPNGLSTTTDEEKSRKRYEEEKEIFWKYSHLFGESNVESFREHFSK